MISYILLAISIIGVISIISLILAVMQAKHGWEDETGFHAAAPAERLVPARPVGTTRERQVEAVPLAQIAAH